jgi:hypothetical protein
MSLEGGLVICADPAEARFLGGVFDRVGLLYRHFYRDHCHFIFIDLSKDFNYVKFIVTQRGMLCSTHSEVNKQLFEAFCNHVNNIATCSL